MKQLIQELAFTIDTAAREASAVEQLSKANDFDLHEAYLIQKHSIEHRLVRGEILTGYKLGFTSRAKMEQMGVHELIWGRLTNTMCIENEGSLNIGQFIHPRAEPEVAFRVGKSIDQALTHENVYEYFDSVAPAIEIIDSRYENFKFTLEDVIADNCSSAGYVIGEWHNNETVFNNLNLSLSINGKQAQHGNTNAILGNPVESLIEISKLSVKYGISINPGMIILAGAATSAEYIKKGDQVEAVFEDLGRVNLKVI